MYINTVKGSDRYSIGLDNSPRDLSPRIVSTTSWPTNVDEDLMSWARKLVYQETEFRKLMLHENDIKKVIFNGPATIVIWCDGTKTVVKCGDMDIYDPEKGLAMAICKYVFGNEGKFKRVFRKWLPEEDAGDELRGTPLGDLGSIIRKIFSPAPEE